MLLASRIAIAAVVAAALVVGAIYLVGSSNNAPSVSPPASGLMSTGPTQGAVESSPLDGRAGDFPQPFTYRIPAGSNYVASRSGAGFYQFRVPVPEASSFTHGVIVRAARGGRVDPCDESSAVTLLGSSQAVMDYLASVPTTTLSGVHAITLDGRPALEGILHVGDAIASCPDVWLWDGEGSITQNGGRDVDWQIRLVDIGLSHIAIYASVDPSWQAVSDALIASFRFDEPRPSGG
jgi:hypothetical protein